jgi:hypothetical protein
MEDAMAKGKIRGTHLLVAAVLACGGGKAQGR